MKCYKCDKFYLLLLLLPNQILTQEENPGVKYEYLLPTNTPHGSSSSEENNSIETETTDINVDKSGSHPYKSPSSDSTELISTSPPGERTHHKHKPKYMWKVVGFSACNKSCGGGVQPPVVRCVREHGSPSKIKHYMNKRCQHLPKPVLNENILRCNTQPCPAEWKIGDWSSCECGKWDEKDFQTREVKCVQELSPELVIRVNEGACLEEMLERRQLCKCSPNRPEKYKNHSHRNREDDGDEDFNDQPHRHKHQKHRAANQRTPLTLIGNTTLSKRAHFPLSENKKAGIWLTSDWNQQVNLIALN